MLRVRRAFKRLRVSVSRPDAGLLESKQLDTVRTVFIGCLQYGALCWSSDSCAAWDSVS